MTRAGSGVVIPANDLLCSGVETASIMQAVIAYITAESEDEALALARALVEERLAACANIIPEMTSVFHWQGRLEQSREAVLILKTREELVPRLIARVQELHSYDCPCIVTWPLASGNPEFLQWIETESQPGADPSIA